MNAKRKKNITDNAKNSQRELSLPNHGHSVMMAISKTPGIRAAFAINVTE